mgnify:CR=1 FL=1
MSVKPAPDLMPWHVCGCHAAESSLCLVDDLVRLCRSPAQNAHDNMSIGEAVEASLCRGLGAKWVRFRPGTADTAREQDMVPTAPPTIRIRVPDPSGELLGMLEVGLRPGETLNPLHRRLMERAAGLCGVLADAERRGQFWPTSTVTRGQVRDGAAPLIGNSLAMQAVRRRIERVAATDFTVLIEGESGSGKELVARQIHELSRRRKGPFVAVNCAALVESLLEAELFGIEDRTATGVRGRKGKFEHASGGTLFLDEVADLSAPAQAKLLRAIQDCAIERVGGHDVRRVDLRMVVATNRRLSDLVAQGAFRSDLFYRLSGVELRVPPLRTRPEDVKELAQYFLARLRGSSDVRLSSAAADALVTYDWPGNVRELERMMEAALTVIHGSQVELDDLPANVRGHYKDALLPSVVQGESLRAWGSRYVRLVLERCGHNKREACRVLDISYHTLQAYLRQGLGAALSHEPWTPQLEASLVREGAATEAAAGEPES